MKSNYGELAIEIVNGRARIAGQGSSAPSPTAAKTAPEGRDPSGDPRYRSKLERAFHAELRARAHGGEFTHVLYEALRLVLAPKTTYLPDFLCRTAAGAIVFYEVKGFMRAAAAVKLKVAAEKFPWWPFILVTRAKGQWIERPVGPFFTPTPVGQRDM